MALEYIIYCDELEDKGPFCSNFYGGALIKASDRQRIEADLLAAREGIKRRSKVDQITEQDEGRYIAFALKFLELVEAGLVKVRVMFTQNIHSTDHLQYEEQDAKYFKLYYQFIKHAFGLMYCNPDGDELIRVAVYLDDAPDTAAALDNFKNYLASLTVLPEFFLSSGNSRKRCNHRGEFKRTRHHAGRRCDPRRHTVSIERTSQSHSEREKTPREVHASKRARL